MRKLSKVFVVFVLILTMIMVLGGCTKKDDEEKSSRRERRNKTEKEEDKNSDDEESSIFGQKNDEGSSAPVTTAAPAEPATDIPSTAAEDAPTPTEEITLAPTEVITPAPAVPDKYLAEFDTLDDLKFIRSEILGKNLDEAISVVERKMNTSISRDEGRYNLGGLSAVYFDLESPGVKLLGSGGFKTIIFCYMESEKDPYNGIVTAFEFCLNGSEKEDKTVTPEIAESAFLQMYPSFYAYFGEPSYMSTEEDKYWEGGAYKYCLWSGTSLGNFWFCWGADLWEKPGNNDCLLQIGIDNSELPSENIDDTNVKDYFRVDEETGFFWMDTSIWNVSYKIFKTLLNTEEITELEEWPYWGHDLEAAFVKNGDIEYACIFQNGKLAEVYLEANENMSSKIYDGAVAKYGNPNNAYMYWSGFPAYEWVISDGYYQQHMEVYDETNHYRQQYVSPDYSE